MIMKAIWVNEQNEMYNCHMIHLQNVHSCMAWQLVCLSAATENVLEKDFKKKNGGLEYVFWDCSMTTRDRTIAELKCKWIIIELLSGV